MKITVMKPVELEVDAIHVNVPVRYDEEDIPKDFPLRTGDTWEGTVDIATGKIREWPQGKAGKMNMKVCDEGIYKLMSGDQVMAELNQEYVPHCIPEEYGDYVRFDIDSNGVVAGWHKYCIEKNVMASFFAEQSC